MSGDRTSGAAASEVAAAVPAGSGAAVERQCWCGSATAHVIGEFASEDARRPALPSPQPSLKGSGGYVLVQCDGCGVLALHPQPTDDQLAVAYSGEYYGASRRKFIAPVAALVGLFQGGRARLVSHHVPKGSRILDVGCGNGGFLQQMQRRGYHVEGTEWTAASAARVPQEAAIPIHAGDLINLDLPSHTYDAITLWHVFEHLRHPFGTLKKIATLLKPGGWLIMSMPNAESTQANRYGTHWLHHDPPRHLFGFGPHSLTKLLHENGFRIERITTWSLEQNPFGEIQSALNGRGFPRDRLYAQLKGLARQSLAVRLADLSRLALRLPWALMRSAAESSRGEGATMTILAQAPNTQL